MKAMFIGVSIAVLALLVSYTSSAQKPAAVESKGQTPKIKFEQVISGPLTDLNGRYKLRVTESTIDPGGYVGPHHHVGPGIRCVTNGELTFVRSGKTDIYRAGDCFFESGDVTHTANNATDKPVVLLIYEIIPAAHSSKGTAIPVPN